MSQTPNQAIKNSGVNFTPTIHRDTYPFIDPVSSKAPAIPPGSSVFITGASKGIGRATAISYACAGFTHIGIGARSSLSDLTAEIIAAATNAGHPAPVVHAVTLDITSRDSVSAAAASVGAAFSGKLDVLVANAGFLEAWTRAAESDPDDWWRSYEVNMLGTYLTYRFFAPLVLASELKTVLFVSSIGAHSLTVGGTAYAGTKLAMLRFAEQVALEEEERGLLAFSIHPGGVPTDLAWGMGEERGKNLLVDTVELAADSVVWLTRERKEWLVGRYVSCTWDMEELDRKREEIQKWGLLKVRMAVEVGN